jgi:hypothetical protein
MVFIETPIFTADVLELLSDDDYAALQQHLVVVVSQDQIRMILVYRKGIKDDLTPKEKGVLRKINAEW